MPWRDRKLGVTRRAERLAAFVSMNGMRLTLHIRNIRPQPDQGGGEIGAKADTGALDLPDCVIDVAAP